MDTAQIQPARPRDDLVAVVIGRNEGERLVAALTAVRSSIPSVIYVDSNSSDGSVATAKQLGAVVIELTEGRLTAARGRQAGLDEVARRFPGARYVQFIDGDCVLDPAWAAAASAFLDANPRVAAVWGRIRELRRDQSRFSRFVDLEWRLTPGRVHLHGGIAMDRVDAIREVGGWAQDLIAGEEPDLAFRMRDKGWEIHFLDADMCTHDIAITRVVQFLRRAMRTGHAYAEVGFKHRGGSGRVFIRRTASIALYGLVLPVVLVALLALYWPAAIFVVALYARQLWSLWRYARHRGLVGLDAAAYAALTFACKFAQAIGVVRYAMGRLTGARARIIEYKRPVPAPQGAR